MSTFLTNYTFGSVVPFANKIIGTVSRLNQGWTNSLALKQGDQALDQLRGAVFSDSPVAGTANNYALDDQCAVFNVTPAGAWTLTGMTGGRVGRMVRIKNSSTNSIFIPHNSGSSAAGNKFGCFSSQGQWIGGLGTADLYYEPAGFWRLLNVTPGLGVSFSPTISSAGGGTPTYTTQNGRLMQYADLAIIHGRVTLATKGTLGAGVLSIGNLPLTCDSTVFGTATIPFFSALVTSYVSLAGYVQVSGTTIPIIVGAPGGVTVAGQITLADVGNTFDVMFSAMYQIGA